MATKKITEVQRLKADVAMWKARANASARLFYQAAFLNSKHVNMTPGQAAKHVEAMLAAIGDCTWGCCQIKWGKQ